MSVIPLILDQQPLNVLSTAVQASGGGVSLLF